MSADVTSLRYRVFRGGILLSAATYPDKGQHNKTAVYSIVRSQRLILGDVIAFDLGDNIQIAYLWDGSMPQAVRLPEYARAV